MKQLPAIILIMIFLGLGCNSVRAQEKPSQGATKAQEIMFPKAPGEQLTPEISKVQKRQKAAAQFKPGDTVIYILKVNLDDLPTVFYPDVFYVGEVIEVTKDGFVVVKWAMTDNAMNGIISESSPHVLINPKIKEKFNQSR